MNKILRVDSKSTLRWFIDYFIKTTPLVFSEISRAVKQNIFLKNIYIFIVNYGNLLLLTYKSYCNIFLNIASLLLFKLFLALLLYYSLRSGQFRGQKGLGPLEKPREIPHHMFCPRNKNNILDSGRRCNDRYDSSSLLTVTVHSSLYTGAVQGYWSTPDWSDRRPGV